MTKKYGHSRFVNLFGSLGYLSLLVQWFWAFIVIFAPLLESDLSWLFVQHGNPATSAPAVQFSFDPTLALMITTITTIMVIGGTIFAMMRLPRAIGKSSAKVTHSAADIAVDMAIRHKRVKKSQRRKLNARTLIVIKAIATLVPIALLPLASPSIQLELNVILVIGAICAAFTIVYFCMQYVIAYLKRVDYRTIW